MKVVVWHAASHHPALQNVSLYDKLWPVFTERVHHHGYEIIHLTDQHDEARGDKTIRFPLNAREVMFSRELAWRDFLLHHAEEGEQYFLAEPDTLLRRKIPELCDGNDMMLLLRKGDNVPPGIRLAKKTAAPFYIRVCDHYLMDVDPKKRDWNGDVDALHMTLGVKNATTLPSEWNGVKIELRCAMDYGVDGKARDAVIWGFKGQSKEQMLKWKDM